MAVNQKQLTNFSITQYWSSIDESWRFAITAFLIARILYAIWSWVIFTIQPVAIQNFEFSGESILAIFSLKDNQGYVYLREVKGTILTFQVKDMNHILDEQTGSVWNIQNGEAIQGQYKNSTLVQTKISSSDIFPYFGATHYPGVWLAMWQRYDANWYVTLAEHGYGSIPGDDHFPPLYPLLLRILQPIFGSAYLAGLFISHVTVLIALKLLYDMFMQWGDQTTARRAFFFFVIYPTFFFFFSAYSEPVFLVTVLLAFRAIQRGYWAWAGFWIFCAILTRLQGASLFIPLLYWIWKDRSTLRNLEYWFGLIVAGCSGIFYLYLRSIQTMGSAIPFVESVWRARIVPPWETYWYAVKTILLGSATFIDVLNWAIITLFIALLIWGWKKIPLEYNLYTTFSIFIILIRIVEAQPLISMSRYSLTLFPTFYVLSLAGENPWLRRLIIYSSVLLALYLSGQFFMWGWVA